MSMGAGNTFSFVAALPADLTSPHELSNPGTLRLRSPWRYHPQPGMATITDMVSTHDDGGSPQVNSLSGLNIASGNYHFEHNIPGRPRKQAPTT